MLPNGFRFQTFHDGPALLVDGRIVADIVPLGDGRFRACMNPLSFSIRYAYLGSLEEAMDFVSEWAMKWEARLRDGVHVPSPL
ncbi:MAG TPA: hypothetical protein VN205_07625 [Thermomonas sp.]|nr:hypothetical protein [Thermomonas sp.]